MTDINPGGQPPPAFLHAARQFNAHEFWACHETLETLWLPAPEPLKTFLQGIIQVAAGFHHVQRCNHKGAMSKLQAGLEKLHRAAGEPAFQSWMDLAAFITDTEAALAEVKHLGPENLNQYCPGRFPVLITQ